MSAGAMVIDVDIAQHIARICMADDRTARGNDRTKYKTTDLEMKLLSPTGNDRSQQRRLFDFRLLHRQQPENRLEEVNKDEG